MPEKINVIPAVIDEPKKIRLFRICFSAELIFLTKQETIKKIVGKISIIPP